MSLFITGTGTSVGKTVVTAGLADSLRRQVESVCVYKPIQTGSPASHPEDPTQIQQWLGMDIAMACSYCFSEPVAPYSADLERTIQPDRLLKDFQQLQKEYKHLLVEGAGGVRVPIAPDYEMLDLMQRLQIPVLVVASPFLGTVNHTLLTVEALLRAKLEVLGVVVSNMPPTNSPEGQDPAIQGLEPMLKAFLPVPLLGFIPAFPLSHAGFQDSCVQTHFDAILESCSLA